MLRLTNPFNGSANCSGVERPLGWLQSHSQLLAGPAWELPVPGPDHGQEERGKKSVAGHLPQVGVCAPPLPATAKRISGVPGSVPGTHLLTREPCWGPSFLMGEVRTQAHGAECLPRPQS